MLTSKMGFYLSPSSIDRNIFSKWKKQIAVHIRGSFDARMC